MQGKVGIVQLMAAPTAAMGTAAALVATTWQCCVSDGGSGDHDQEQRADQGTAALENNGASLRVVLYYQYRDLEDAAAECRWQRSTCQRLELMGRVRVAREGVNGTLCGTASALGAYVHEMEAAGWSDIDWKFSDVAATGPPPFASLVVSEKAEIIALSGAEKGSAALERLHADAPVGGEHLSPTEWREHVEEARATADSGVVLLDVRNGYEVNSRFSTSCCGNSRLHDLLGIGHLTQSQIASCYVRNYANYETNSMHAVEDWRL